MNKKILATVITGIFLLTCLSTLSVAGSKASSTQNDETFELTAVVYIEGRCTPVGSAKVEAFAKDGSGNSYTLYKRELPGFPQYYKEIPAGVYDVVASGVEGYENQTIEDVTVCESCDNLVSFGLEAKVKIKTKLNNILLFRLFEKIIGKNSFKLLQLLL